MMNNTEKMRPLSPRETEVLKWTACGKTSGEISRLLLISEDTVNAHIKNACAKLDAVNKTHATAIVIAHGMVRIGPLPDLVIPLPTLLGLSMKPSGSATMSRVASRTTECPTSKKSRGVSDG